MKRTFIIAEAGVNHNGSLKLAIKLIDAAKKSGADAVKFQTFKADSLVSKNAKKAAYQQKTTLVDESQYAMIKKLELSLNDHHQLIAYCKKRNIEFLSSPFDLESIDLLVELGLCTIKIPSGEITNLPYLQKIGKLNLCVILSTGMAEIKEISDAIKVLTESGTDKEKIVVLHCNTEYPTPYKDVNLKAMITIRDKFNIKVGYSDHTSGIEIPIAAVALGAEIIEKHFTLDKTMVGPDHAASLEPQQLKQMINSIRNIEIAMGDGLKRPSTSEEKNKMVARKSLVAACSIKKGDLFTEENITVKRPGNGISPMKWYKVIGKTSNKNFNADDIITL
jgi:N,N'-diacetyllegionaminate synthase